MLFLRKYKHFMAWGTEKYAFLRKFKDFIQKYRISRFSQFVFFWGAFTLFGWAGLGWAANVCFSKGNTKISSLGVPKSMIFFRKF